MKKTHCCVTQRTESSRRFSIKHRLAIGTIAGNDRDDAELLASDHGSAPSVISVRKLQRSGVRYRSLRGKAGPVELGILRLQQVRNPLREQFVAALRSVAQDVNR